MTLSYSLRNAPALKDPLADTLAEVEEVTHGASPGDAHALQDPLADTLADVETIKLVYSLGDAQVLFDTG